MENCKRILIANENNEETKEISQKLTTDETFIETTNNGRKAIDLISENKYDLIISDLVLAEVDGFEVIERAKELNRQVKIIVLSALSSDTFIKKATSLGVDYYMLKPIDCNILAKRVDDLFESKDKTNNLLISKLDTDKEIEEKITNIFITVGIPAHIKGY
ncbi:MAG: response regulator, partial [Clostridia bacterium]|nr:response regulator [Clostridia bacterium]